MAGSIERARNMFRQIKKIMAVFLAASILSFASCEEGQTDTTTETTPAVTAETTTGETPPATVPTIIETETWNWVPGIEPDGFEELGFPTVITPKYEDQFEEWGLLDDTEPFPKKQIFLPESAWQKNPAAVGDLEAPPFVFLRILGVETEYQELAYNNLDYTVYNVQIVDAFGLDYFETNRTYRLAWLGTSEVQIYGRPPLEIGQIYGRFITGASEEWLSRTKALQAALMYKVEIHDGKRYLYGYGNDLYAMHCAEAITDEEENLIYEAGKHDKVIAACEKANEPLPTFDYRCEVEAFYEEVCRRVAGK